MVCSCSEKNKSWENRRVLLEWENTHMKQICADNHTKEDGSKEELLVLQDKLGDKLQKKYQYMCQKVDNNLFWNYHH